MTVRPAKVADIPRILDIIEEAHKRSVYVAVGDVDRDYARMFFSKAMRFNGGHGCGASLFLVSENSGLVEGYFFAILDRTYQIGTKLTANEVHFYLTPTADARDCLRIIDAFSDWGGGNPNVVELRIGESNILGEPDPRFATLLERKSFEKGATVFTKRIEVQSVGNP